MNPFARRAGQWLAFRFEPETAHRMAIGALKLPGNPVRSRFSDSRLALTVAGLDFGNPVGVAAGFDKDAEVPDALLRAGFGFTEIGTITPRAQPGNARPRVFRLIDDQAVINRLGFNNGGHDAAFERLRARAQKGIVGVNIGANKDADDRIADYVTGLSRFYDLAAYFTVNISSPNTPGLRDLQGRKNLADLLSRLMEAHGAMAHKTGRHVPVFLKIAPDITEPDLDDITDVVLDKKLDGMIVSNTTLSRAKLRRPIDQAGGLSGAPLFERATIVLAKTRQRVGKELALIGVGGVRDGDTAAAKIRAGADLVQLYTGMIYHGPDIADHINRGLTQILAASDCSCIADLRDLDCAQWAAKAIGD